MNFFAVIFQVFWSAFKKLFFRTPLSNCVLMFINFYFCWDFSIFRFFCLFIERTLHLIFWKHDCLFLYALYRWKHVLCKLGETPPILVKMGGVNCLLTNQLFTYLFFQRYVLRLWKVLWSHRCNSFTCFYSTYFFLSTLNHEAGRFCDIKKCISYYWLL